MYGVPRQPRTRQIKKSAEILSFFCILLIMPSPAGRDYFLLLSNTYVMHLTIFQTPVINHFMRWVALLSMRLTGWKVEGMTPQEKICADRCTAYQ
jgi:hypothetical protein